MGWEGTWIRNAPNGGPELPLSPVRRLYSSRPCDASRSARPDWSGEPPKRGSQSEQDAARGDHEHDVESAERQGSRSVVARCPGRCRIVAVAESLLDASSR